MTDIHHDGPCPSPASASSFPPSSYPEEGKQDLFWDASKVGGVEVDVPRLLRIAEVMQMIEEDCETDAEALDYTAFTPRGVGESFGNVLAAIQAVARANKVLASTLAALAAPQEETHV